MSRDNEARIYSDLQDAKDALRKALKDIKELDDKLGGYNTFSGEVAPIIDEIFPGELEGK
jgi:hypothetical protein